LRVLFKILEEREMNVAQNPINPMQRHLETLSYEELQRILDTLPVDITFVDADDRVRYFNKLGSRTFPRSPAAIGQPVQLCHPEASVDRVQRILDDFREGKRDVAEFWITYHGRLVHIRYFAVRDRAGTYRGCLEVTQDITDIQKLSGERRLLDTDVS